jgi:hypothetical protein
LCRRLRAMGVYTTDGHANFVYLPAVGRPWREVFGDSGLKARYYPDGAARITVGSRASTQAVLAAMAKWQADQTESGSAARKVAWPLPHPTNATRSLRRWPTASERHAGE